MAQKKREKDIVLLMMTTMVMETKAKLNVPLKDYAALSAKKLFRNKLEVIVNILLSIQNEPRQPNMLLSTYHPQRMKSKVSHYTKQIALV